MQGLSPEALNLLLRYPWPGNVRELQSVLRQGMLQTTGPVLITDFLPREVREGTPRNGRAGDPEASGDLVGFIRDRLDAESKELHNETIEYVERLLLRRVLTATGGNQSRAAEILGIARGSLRNKIQTARASRSTASVSENEEADG